MSWEVVFLTKALTNSGECDRENDGCMENSGGGERMSLGLIHIWD